MRRRLVLVFAAVTAMVAIAFLLPLALLVRNVARDRAVSDAKDDTLAIAPVLAVTTDATEVLTAVTLTGTGGSGRMSVFLPDGTVIGPEMPPSPYLDAALRDGRAWSGDVPGGVEVVTPLTSGSDIVAVVRAFVPSEDLSSGVAAAWFALAGVGVLLVLVSVAVADRLSRSITRPVVDLAEAAHRLGAGDLTTRVEPEGPRELEEVGEAFNLLARRVDQLLDDEREAVADLAHRLRTPLTSLRLDLDLVDDPEVAARLERDIAAVGEAVDSLIHESRRRVRDGVSAESDLCSVVADRVDFWSALAEEQGRPVSLDRHPVALPVGVGRADLEAAVDVLIENVFSHTDESVGFAVSTTTDEGYAIMRIDDDGGGVDDLGVVERGRSDGGSTGLGLDIVRRTAESVDGVFAIGASESGGARFEIWLPLVAPVEPTVAAPRAVSATP